MSYEYVFCVFIIQLEMELWCLLEENEYTFSIQVKTRVQVQENVLVIIKGDVTLGIQESKFIIHSFNKVF